MKTKKFLSLFALVLCAVLAFGGEAFAYRHDFYYDSSVSAARNKVAKYAYDILNYEWTATSEVLGYRGRDNSGNYISPYRYSAGTKIQGIPYTDYYMKSFQDYQNLDSSSKSSKLNSYKMQYGMVCATLVTDCIRQGFSDIVLYIDNQCLFHKRGTWGANRIISSVSDNIWWSNHSENDWNGIWTSIRTSQENSRYPAYQSLQRGD